MGKRMLLELAEGRPGGLALRTVASLNKVNYLLISDPFGEMPPVYVSELILSQFTPAQFSALINNFGKANTKKAVALIKNNIAAVRSSALSEEDTDYVETANTIVTIIDTVVGWFDSGSTSTPSNMSPGNIVNQSGLVVCAAVFNGQTIVFGIHPSHRQLIAFSSPAHLKSVFPNLPHNIGSPSFPYPPLPPQVPPGMVQFVLNHPNVLCREKQGGGYEVVPGAQVIATDANGNPITNVPPPGNPNPPSADEGGIGKWLPLGLLALFSSNNK